MKNTEDKAKIKAYMAAKMAHIKMYNECMNLADGLDVAKFAELVRADEREKVAQWMIGRGYATGHGDTTEDLLAELGNQFVENWTNSVMKVAEAEREACAKVCKEFGKEWNCESTTNEIIAAIRARGEK